MISAEVSGLKLSRSGKAAVREAAEGFGERFLARRGAGPGTEPAIRMAGNGGSYAGRLRSRRLPVESSLNGEFAFGAGCADFAALPFEGEVEGAVHAEAASEPAVSAVGVGSSEGSAGGERSSVSEHSESVARFRFEPELASGIRGAEFRRSLAVPQGPGLRYAEIVRTAVTRRFLRFSSANML